MTEGWYGEQYFIIFPAARRDDLADAYGIPQALPHHRLVGLCGWDDFIVVDSSGRSFTVPTVPLDAAHLRPVDLPTEDQLKSDRRLCGKMKWYIKPLVFGGDPQNPENLSWINLEQHTKVVAWFNNLYRKMSENVG